MLRASSLKILSAEQLCCRTALTALNTISVRAEYPGHRRWALRVRHSSWGAVVKSTVRIIVFISLQGRVTQSQALCSTSPAGQHNLAAVWPPQNPQSHIKLSHCIMKVRTQLPLIYSTAHFSAPHNTRVMTQRKSQRDRGEEIRNTLPASRVKTFATLEQKNLSGEIGSKRKTHPFVFKNLIPLQM